MLESSNSVIEVAEWLRKEFGDNVHVGGFSQGCALALASHLNWQHQFKSVMGLSGSFCSTHSFDKVDLAAKSQVPLFLFHGKADAMIPAKMAKLTYEALRAKGLVSIDLQLEAGMGHELS